MTNYPKSFDVVGFTADADYWCAECAAHAYGSRDVVSRTDREGNWVYPIFRDQAEPGMHCGTCGEELGA